MKIQIGNKYNRLTVIEYDFTNKHHVKYYKCKCDCGELKSIRMTSITSGSTKSCGCLNEELKRQRKPRFKHGFAKKEALYNTWLNMRRRCYDIKNNRYENYGGRGIRVCEDWNKEYIPFRDWAYSNGYKEGLTIDRVDVNGNYEPKNCRWADVYIQQNNTTRNKYIEYKQMKLTISEWSRYFGLSVSCFTGRLKRKWIMEEIENSIKDKEKK